MLVSLTGLAMTGTELCGRMSRQHHKILVKDYRIEELLKHIAQQQLVNEGDLTALRRFAEDRGMSIDSENVLVLVKCIDRSGQCFYCEEWLVNRCCTPRRSFHI